MIVVVLETGLGLRYRYGPFASQSEARQFADFLSSEVDPARVAKETTNRTSLRSPLAEMLAWYREHQNEELDQYRAEESS